MANSMSSADDGLGGRNARYGADIDAAVAVFAAALALALAYSSFLLLMLMHICISANCHATRLVKPFSECPWPFLQLLQQ